MYNRHKISPSLEMFPFTRCKIKSKEQPVIIVEVNIFLQVVDLRTTNAIIVVKQGTCRRCDIRTLYPVKMTSVKPIRVSVGINGQSLDMQLDTGASVSVRNVSTYFKL